MGSRLVLGVDLGTSMSNLSQQNSLQGWDITEGRKLDQKFKVDKCNQGEGTKPDLARETSNQQRMSRHQWTEGVGRALRYMR